MKGRNYLKKERINEGGKNKRKKREKEGKKT